MCDILLFTLAAAAAVTFSGPYTIRRLLRNRLSPGRRASRAGGESEYGPQHPINAAAAAAIRSSVFLFRFSGIRVKVTCPAGRVIVVCDTYIRAPHLGTRTHAHLLHGHYARRRRARTFFGPNRNGMTTGRVASRGGGMDIAPARRY